MPVNLSIVRPDTSSASQNRIRASATYMPIADKVTKNAAVDNAFTQQSFFNISLSDFEIAR